MSVIHGDVHSVDDRGLDPVRPDDFERRSAVRWRRHIPGQLRRAALSRKSGSRRDRRAPSDGLGDLEASPGAVRTQLSDLCTTLGATRLSSTR